MSEIDIDALQKSIKVRPLKSDDYKRVVDLQKKSFSTMKPWTREQFSSQLRLFAAGQVGVEYEGVLIGSSSSLIIDFDEYSDNHSWQNISDNGYITNHDEEGDTLYGIEIMVDPDFRSMRIGKRLYDARKKLVRERNLKRIVIGGRVPNYHKYADSMSIHDYVEAVIDKKLYDPVLTFQVANGFVLKRIIKNYLTSDEESKGNALLLEWVNLHYQPRPAEFTLPSHPVRICSVQYRMRRIASFDEFAGQAEFFVDVASTYKSDFVVFPEIFTLQLLSFLPQERPGITVRKLNAFTRNYLDLFQQLAIKYAVNIVGGSHYSEESGHLYNIAYLFQRNGTVNKQYKIHITPNERRWWGVKAGDDIQVFNTDRGRASILICYDIEFPEICRIATRNGAQLFFVPFCTDERHGYLRVRYCSQARAIENQVFVATAGCVGNIPSVENMDINYAQSGIYTPSDFPFSRDGIAGECQPNVETVVIADVDLDVLRRNRLRGTVRTWQDRRTDLYDVIEKKNPPEKS
ncbi:GNAT family N-acetyltransferase [candidate division KSB1 bacterium]|nr:GNAT family N-acetyltransferase [candidate division KSB1 bacterium]